MQRRNWIVVLSVLAVTGAWMFWPHGPQAGSGNRAGASSAGGTGVAAARHSGTNASAKTAVAALNTNKLAFRLSNTTNSIRRLEAMPHAILLANAFIDTDKPLDLKIPAHLKSAGDPGSYIVQARGVVGAPFRAALAQAGAQIVSYIPNNAYLVRLTAGEAGGLAGSPLVQSVLPYEPYYKLQSSLLGLAVNEQALPPGTAVNLGLFAADAAAAEQQVEKLGAKIIGRDRSAFGPVLRVLAPADWTALAQVSGVQILEPAHARVAANDLSRVTVGVSPDTTSGMTNDYAVQGYVLNGNNVLVAVNDSGVDATHPDLSPRVLGINPIDLVDTAGHGTHVAGIIASSGANSMNPTDVGAFAEGSVSNADFRGKAPLASVFSINDSGRSDYQLQTTAALTNALISNNSWDYGNGAAEYDLAAASYDAATRDALPGATGSQPVLFVFAAGNSGGGDNDGAEGSGDTILSPGTAKNVITVGALEQLRNLTNIVTLGITAGTGTNTPTTNQVAYWQTQTDSGDQVAFYSSRGNVGIGTEGTFGRFKPDVVSPGTFVVSTRSGQWDTNAYFNPTNVAETDYTLQIVDTNGLVYYNVTVPPNAVGVNITISSNQFSPSPFPLNLPIWVKQTSFPTTNAGGYDFVTSKDGVTIPPDGPAGYFQLIQGNGFSFAVGNSTNVPVNYNLSVQVLTTNDLGDLEAVLFGMDELLKPYYRYESGTSMAAADVSGVLALIQDYFTNKFTPALTPSPALMKALLINGSRSVGNYALALTNGINFQGWGLDNIQSCVPANGLLNQLDTPGSSFFVEQNPQTALATGDSHTFIVNLITNSFGQYLQMQATLVWTDPPGDPSAAIKLVNNLDLIITNLDTGDVYFGNDISPDIGFNEAWDTNMPPNLDTINNVENILLSPQLASRYSVTVVGRAVNVNAVTAQTNNALGQYAPNIVQDFALVVSVGEGEVTNAFTVSQIGNGISVNPNGDQNLTVVATTNAPLFNQFVGANSPLLGTNTLPLGTNTVWGPHGVVTIGQTNQWHFYIVTNNGPGADFTNAAFITFDAVTLSIPRMGVLETGDPANATRPEADIDLYVSQDSSITNLNPVAISNSLAGVSRFGVGDGGSSLSQGGTEYVFFTNSAPGQVYYIGVKSEDQMGSEYAFLPVFTDIPFSSTDQNGNQIVPGLLLPQRIPDGDNAHPGVINVFALAILPMTVEKVTVTNLNEHQNFGDLFGTLTFSEQHVVLNNHDGFGNTYLAAPRVYDDSRNRPPGTTNTDGPGSLVNFRAKSALGPWILSEMDNSLTQTGQVTTLSLLIQPHRDLTQPGIIVSVPPGGWFIDYVDVTAGYTNLTFNATNVTRPTPGVLPIQMYEKYGNDPTLTDYDQEATLTNGVPEGNSISVGPPLAQGQYFVGLYNPNTTAQNVFISATLGIDASVNDIFNYTATSGQTLLDDAVTPVPPLLPPFVNPATPGSSISVGATQLVASVNVGIVVQSPRISDYTFTLVSPTGQRVLLGENRGGGTTGGAGDVFVYTNIINSTATGGAAPNTNYLAVPAGSGTVPITYDFFDVPDEMTVYGGTNPANFYPPNTSNPYFILDTGFTNGSATILASYSIIGVSNITIIMNQFGNPYATRGDAWNYTAGAANTNYEYLVFTDNTNLATVPIKFAQPPYNFSQSSTNFLLSNFNLATNGDYLAPTNIYDAFGGWSVPTNLVTYATIVTNGQFALVTNVVRLTNNLVSVVSDPSSALTGDAGASNFLALADGTITRSIATIPGRLYNVTFWYRGPGIEGWWRGEGNGTDSSDPENDNNNGTLIGRFNFPAGEVGQAFEYEDPGNTYQFTGTNTYVQVPASASLNVGAGGGFTVEGWINPTNLTHPQPLVEWLAQVPTNTAVTNIVIVQGPVMDPATGHYYYLLAATNWTTSESWAQELGGHLVTLDTANEQNWVYDTFTAYETLNRYLWTGLTNKGPNTAFAWSSGLTNVTYTNWLATQPKDCGNNNYTLILSPTNAIPGLWALADDSGFICGSPATNPVYGVVEVDNIPTNSVQFWISGTNWTPGIANVLQGCLYANIVDTNYVSHEIFSAPGLLTSNVYQHVALTYNTNSGIAALYLNGTNVATTNLGVFVPKTDGDLLIGWDMSRYTNNYYSGEMDEMSLYSRSLSHAEISAIYHVSADTTNRLLGKFDPSVTPAVGLAEALVSFGPSSNVIFGVNNQWKVNSYTFTAASNSMPLTISGIEPGILLDAFAVAEAPETNLYYFPEQALASLTGGSAFGNWTLQIWDNRAGAYITNANQLVNWQLSFVLESNAVVSATLPPQTPVATTVPSGQIVYYSVTVPNWALFATNILVSSSQPVDLLFNPTNPPTGSNPGDLSLLLSTPATSGVGQPILAVNSPLPFTAANQAGQTYYLGVRNNSAHAAAVTLEVDYDMVNLTNGVPFTDVLSTNLIGYNPARYFEFDVSSNAYEATFQLLQLSGNADLVLQKGVPLPGLTSSDYGSFSVGTADENIFVLTNSSPVPLSAGRWYLGVIKRDSGTIHYSVLAKELDVTNLVSPTIIPLANGVPFNFTAGPGAALTNFFVFHATNSIIGGTNYSVPGLRFELYNLTGNGDLTVQTSAPPFAPPFVQSSQNGGSQPELIFIRTNNVLTSLAADWYLGVPNRETNLVNFTIIAEVETNLFFPAFPGAVGAGGGTVGGGRGTNGTVYHVTSTGDSGFGTLRDAVSSTNRTVVFDVSGTITLLSPLVISSSYLTIAGQTAPGGITVAGDMTTVQSAHDVIIRDVRFRAGAISANTNVASLDIDGSFENPPGRLGGLYPAGQTFGGWTVISGDVNDVPALGWQPADGTTSLDMNGNTTGVISRNVATIPGQTYILRFAYAGNPSGGPNIKTMQVSWGGNLLGTVSFDTTGHTTDSMGWVYTNITVVGTGNDALQFASTVPAQFGPALDAVSLTPTTIITDTRDSLQFLNVSNVIADHISAAWSANNQLSVLNSSNVTVQWSIMADGLSPVGECSYNSNNIGNGSLLRYGFGTLSLHHNLYANNYTGSPRVGDNLTLDFVNNVVYNWGLFPGSTGGTNDFDYSTSGCTNQVNYVCNYLIAGPETAINATNYAITNIAFFGGVTNAHAANWVFQTNNFMDSDTNGILNGADTGWGMFTNQYTQFSHAFPTPPVPTDEAFLAYERVLDFAGVDLNQRDSVDSDIVTQVRTQTGRLISTEPLAGLVAWWKGENNALESVGANNGTLKNGAGFAPGKVGTAFNLNGVNQYVLVQVQTNSSLDVGQGSGFTFEGWIKPTFIPTTGPDDMVVFDYEKVLGTSSGSHVGASFAIHNATISGLTGGCLYANVKDTLGNDYQVTSPANLLVAGTWQHIALTYDKCQQAVAIYIDGALTTKENIGYINPETTFTNILIGARTFFASVSSPNNQFAGGMDELSFYKRALSAAEIASIYNAGSAGKFAQPANAPVFLDTDQDGIPDFWEITFGQNPTNASNFQLSTNANFLGYTDLEEYLAWLAGPHALTVTNTPVGVDLMQLFGKTGNLSFSVTNAVNGTVYLTNVLGSATYTGSLSNRIAVFTPINTSPPFSGYASFDVEVTNTDTAAYFGPVTVSVLVSAVPIAYANNTNSPPVLGSLTNQTINELTLLTVTNTATDANTNLTLTYTVTMTIDTVAMSALGWINPFANTINTAPVISANGIITWTPSEAQGPGVYIITTVVSDNGIPPLFATNSFSVTVNETNSAPTLPVQANQTINELTTLIVTNTATDTDLPLNPLTYTLTVAIDTNAMNLLGWTNSYANTTNTTPVISTNGIITWTPSESQGPGVYTFTTVVTDTNIYALANKSLSATNTFSVTVNEVNTAPVLPIQPNVTMSALSTLVVTNTATDSDIPPNPLTYTLLVSPPALNAVISPNGIITWMPTVTQAPGVYTFTTIVTDTNAYALFNQSLSATNSFTVNVLSVAAPFAFTQPATLVTGTSAQLNGMATPNGLPSLAWFDWGTTTLYGNQTPAGSVGAGYNVVYTTSQITGLASNVPYHFRLVVSNAVGVVYGFDQILDEANVVVWGADYAGQANVPPGLSNVVSIAGAYDHSLALKNDGTAAAWGDSAFGQGTVPAGLGNLVALAGGQYYSLALKSNGTVAAWGANILNQTNVPPGLNNVVMIAGGTFSSLALRNNGAVVAWGAGFFNLTNVPASVSNTVAIAGGSYHSLAIKNDGTVTAWGDDSVGQTDVPPGLTNVVAIAGGNYHSLALKDDGTVVAWGDNSAGQTDVPVGLSGVVAVAAGGFHSMALKNDGTVVAWGDPSAGQINVPNGLGNVVAIAAGYLHSMALTPESAASFTNVILDLTNGVPQTNSILAGGVTYYRVNVPTNADFATNLLLFTLNGPLNMWFTTNTPPTIAGINDVLLLNAVTNGSSVLNTNTTPLLVPGSTYYLGINNTHGFAITYGIEVDFHFTNSLAQTNTIPISSVTATNGGYLLIWYAPTNDIFQVQFTDSLAPVNWQTFSNIITYTGPITPTNGLFSFFDDGSQYPFTGLRFYQLVLLGSGSSPSNLPPVLPAQPTRIVNPLNPLVVTNTATDATIPAPTLTYTLTSTVAGTNVPVINTNTGVITWTPNISQAGSTNTLTTIATASGLPTLTATNSFTVIVTPLPALSSVTATNGGYLLIWYAPTNDIFQVQFTDTLAPVNWQTFSNIITYTGPITPTNGLFSFFDDGSQYPFTGLRFYQLVLLGSGSSPSNLPPVLPAQPTRIVNPLNPLVVTNAATDATIPAPTLTYTLTSTMSGTNVPVINTNTGVITWTPNILQAGSTNTLTTIVTASGLPTLTATNSFTVIVTPLPALSGVTATNGGYLLTWYAPTNDIFQVQFTDTLAPVNWQTFSNIITYTGPITPTNGLFSFFDNGSQYPFTGLRFYQLILLGVGSLPTNPPAAVPPVLPAQPTRIVNPLNPLVVTNAATDATIPAPALTYTLTSTVSGTNVPVINTNTGVITWTPNISQAGSTNTLTTIVTASGLPTLTATNSFTVIVTPLPTLSSVTATNGGYLLTWYAPTNDIFQVQFTDTLAPVNWQTFSNIITYTGPITPTNGLFSFFDNGSQYPFTGLRFYQLILLGVGSLPTNPPAAVPPVLPAQPTRIVNPLNPLVVTNAATDATVPAPTLTYTLTSTVAGTNVPVINTNTGVITWTPNILQAGSTNTLTTIVTASGLPTLTATNSFTVIVTPLPALSSVTATNGGYLLIWYAPTNDIFQVQFTDSLAPVNWQTFSNIITYTGPITPTNGLFSFFDNGSQYPFTGLRFYQLILLGVGSLPTNPPPPFAATLPAQAVTGTNARLNGFATPNGTPATAWFEWGATRYYGSQTTPISVGSGSNVVFVTSQITGLLPGQSYHYRLVTSNGGGIARGFDQMLGEGNVMAWGASTNNLGTFPNYGQIVIPSGLTNTVAVAGGGYHSLALKNDGTVVAWGAGLTNDSTGYDYGQSIVPAGLINVAAVAGGAFHSAALKSDGTVVAWGDNSFGGETNVPAGLSNVVLLSVPNGGFHNLALKNDGTVIAWGQNNEGQTNVPGGLSNVVSVAAGGFHSLALKNDGTVIAWGAGLINSGSGLDYGQSIIPSGLNNVVAIAAGLYHSLALKNNGAVVVWGAGTNNTGLPFNYGQSVVPPGLSNVVTLAGGEFNSLVLKSDGKLLAWGAGANNSGFSYDYGQSMIPSGISNVVQVESGAYHTLALLPAATNLVIVPSITSVSTGTNGAAISATNGLTLTWNSPIYQAYEVQWTTNLTPVVNWRTLPNIITSTNGTFYFIDTNAPFSMKYYRLLLLP